MNLPRTLSLLALGIGPGLLQAEEKVDFNFDIQPIISAKCFHCHGPDEKSRKAELRLDLREDALKARDGTRAIVPGDLAASELMTRILSTDEEEVMPPPKEEHALTPAEIDLFKRWIQQGAEYKPHWAFVAPHPPSLPAATPAGTHPIDAFVAERLQKAGLAPNPPAERAVLLRRVALDLTGLPPTTAELHAFLADQSPNAYEKQVERLLAAPAFGERWARMWLDLARYADSTGFGSDKFRLNIWPYRDWVINAFNRNQPYDQFTIEQLAGDLLPGATVEQRAATAFHRNTMTNVEGGTDDEEYRVAAVKDRVATTGQVWMGLTVGCAQCHTHKFDPISHRDYYSLFAIFNQSEDADREDEEPKMPLPTHEVEEKRAQVEKEIAALEAELSANPEALAVEQQSWEAEMSRHIHWTVLQPQELQATQSVLKTRADGSIEVSGPPAPGPETYTIRTGTALSGITAFRLEALTDPALPKNGPGRSAEGNAVLSEFRVNLDRKAPGGSQARFVRVELPGKEQVLSLAEVQVLSGGANVALKGKASQSSTDFEAPAARAIDGNTKGDFYKANSVTHTRKESNPWWEVDLGEEKPIDSITLWNRTDNNTGVRLANFQVVLLNGAHQSVWEEKLAFAPNPSLELKPGNGRSVALKNPSADFNQTGFEAAKALDRDPKTGWAFGPETGQNHAIVFETAAPDPSLGAGAGESLVFTLRQDYGERHTLGRFRLSATTDPRPVGEVPAEIRHILDLEPTEREPAQRKRLAAFFRPLSKHGAGIAARIEEKKQALAKIIPVALPIMKERPSDKRRPSFILTKGNFTMPAEPVSAALPVAFVSASSAPAPGSEVNRLTMARWLVGRDNPLTARVAVNRTWAQLFGTGIVESEEDFGTQGSLPSHPELLDWLAIHFMDKGWDFKDLLKTIVTSQTYRQSSRTTPAQLQKDPRNRLLAHYPRRRLDADGVRDQALFLSGLLSRKMGGPSVYPPQPPGLWNVAFNERQNSYPTSTGEDRYRRGLYTFWRRTMPNPTMTTFDAPSREICVIRRIPTNTPLQAFVTLNDPVFVECAQALARRIMNQPGPDVAARLRFALELCVGRSPEATQVAALEKLFADSLATYRADPAGAQKLATDPLGALPAGTDPAEAAAWTVVANVLLNLDAVLTKS